MIEANHRMKFLTNGTTKCIVSVLGIICVLQKMKVILINQLRDQLLIPAGRVKHDVKETWIEH